MSAPASPPQPADSASLDSFLSLLAEAKGLGAEVVHRQTLAAQEARYGDVDPPLAPVILKALRELGVDRLWQHQAEGIAAARRGADVLVTTPTASGKSLIFQLPVLQEALVGGPGRALFLFPLKALGQDQKGKLDALAERCGLEDPTALSAIYDGDTPAALRRRIRASPPRVLITNPDMLHLGILAYHSSWLPFLRDLKWLVLDELHTYRGVFGSHFHHVLQRLLRLCRAAGSRPAVIAASATAANAEDFAQRLTGRTFHAVSESGAPREGRHLLLLRPTASPYTTALELTTTLLDAGLKTIVFTKARRITELLYSWLRRRRPELGKRVTSYRAGFLPEERRRIEQRLFDGELDGVISTSALEMGIDVGGLDACVLVGYPGSVMATWQRSGRVGRSGRESVTALVAMPDALDQYFLEHPQELLGRPLERLIVDPANRFVASGHLLCAAAERPLSRSQDQAYLERHALPVAQLLAEDELLESADGGELFCLRRRPHSQVSLRGSGQPFEIRLKTAEGPIIGTVDGARAFREAHPGAVYLHGGRSFLVHELDLEQRRAVATAENVEYFTSPLADKETEILEILRHSQQGELTAWLGRVRVRERVVGYERKRLMGQQGSGPQALSQHPLDLPPTEFETVGLWWAAPRHLQASLEQREEHYMGSLHACEHAAISLLPTLLLCDRGDIGGISQPFHPQVGTGAIFVYDGHSGGVGIAEAAFDQLPELLTRVRDLLITCPCEVGCPSCVQSPKCGNGNRPLDKAGALRLARLLLGEEEPVEKAGPRPEITLLAAEVDEVVRSTSSRFREAEPSSGAEPAASESRSKKAPSQRAPSKRVRSKSAPSAEASSAQSRAEAASAEEAGLEAVELRQPERAPQARPRLGGAGQKGATEEPPITVLFDIETRRSADDVGGWGQIHRMGVAVAVVCYLEENRFEIFHEDRVWELAACLRAASLVVGFNSRRFDYRVLNGYTGEDYSRTLKTLDLLEEVEKRLGKRLSLSHLCQETLGADKSADGLQSLEWVKQGRLDLVEAYCRKDVELLRDLYLFGRREGYVLYRDRGRGKQRKLPVEW